MKYVLKLVMLSGLFSMAAVGHSATFTQKIMRPVIEYQCHQKLEDSKLWRVSSVLMSTQYRQTLANQVCDCVAENALNDVSATELAAALVSEERKSQLVKQVVKNSLSICVPKIVRQ